MSAPTVQAVALVLLRDRGIYSLNPSAAQANVIRPADLDDVALAISSAFQEGSETGGSEQLRRPNGGFIQPATTVTMNVTQGSATVASFTGFASWMLGCTIRINGDPQDNEVLSQTLLARPYTGPTANGIGGTVFCDCFTLDSDVEKVVGPLQLTDNRICTECTSRLEFVQRSSYPAVPRPLGTQGTIYPGFSFAPFWSLGPKPSDAYPSAYFLDTYRDTTKDYLVRRLRLTPIPTATQSVGWEEKVCPIRVTSADIVSGLNTIVMSDEPSDPNIAQIYTYLTDFNGYRMFRGGSSPDCYIYFNAMANSFIAQNGFDPSLPGEYWESPLGSSPLGTYNPAGGATGFAIADTTDTGGGSADPGTKIIMPNGWVESILIPIARQINSGTPTFKNTEIKPEINREYVLAKQRMVGATVSGSGASKSRYL